MSVLGYLGNQIGAHRDHWQSLSLQNGGSFLFPEITLFCAKCNVTVIELNMRGCDQIGECAQHRGELVLATYGTRPVGDPFEGRPGIKPMPLAKPASVTVECHSCNEVVADLFDISLEP